MRALLLAFAVLMLLPAPAGAYRHRMPQPRVWAHHELNPSCEGAPCANPMTAEIWIGVHPLRFEVSHEIGHVWWRQVAIDSDRAWITELTGFPVGTPWTSSRPNAPSPDELAADAYAACDLGMRPYTAWVTSYGYYPTARRHRRICNGIAIIGLVRDTVDGTSAGR